MAYMFLPTSTRPLLLSWVLAAYLACIGVLWALGACDRYYRTGGRATQLMGNGPRYRSSLGLTAPAFGGPPARTLRASLATMTAGMAYMLLTM